MLLHSGQSCSVKVASHASSCTLHSEASLAIELHTALSFVISSLLLVWDLSQVIGFYSTSCSESKPPCFLPHSLKSEALTSSNGWKVLSVSCQTENSDRGISSSPLRCSPWLAPYLAGFLSAPHRVSRPHARHYSPGGNQTRPHCNFDHLMGCLRPGNSLRI